MFVVLKRLVDDQKWLDTLGDPLQKYVSSVFSNGGASGKQIKNVLNGVWLGHPLHPVLTDVPVGAWTLTMVLDGAAAFSDDEGLRKASNISIATGLIAAVASAATGWTDWSDTYGRERKVGLLHGLLMVSTTVTYGLSLILRSTGSRGKGIALSNIGYGLLSAGAYFGGEEVYDIGYGVNHTAFEHGPSKFTEAMRESDLQPNKPTRVEVDGTPVVLVKIAEQIYALGDTCVHAGCSLSTGHLEGASIVCPCHGSQFDLRDGSVINGPATMPEPAYETRVTQGGIEVKVASL